MAKNIYRTAQGQAVDIDNLKIVNEGVVAVGNMNVNARGDRVAPDGTILETRNQVMKRRYGAGITVVDSPVGKPSREVNPQVEDVQVEETDAPTNEVLSQEVSKGKANEPTVITNTLRGNLASQVAANTHVDGSGLNDLSLPVTKLKRI